MLGATEVGRRRTSTARRRAHRPGFDRATFERMRASTSASASCRRRVAGRRHERARDAALARFACEIALEAVGTSQALTRSDPGARETVARRVSVDSAVRLMTSSSRCEARFRRPGRDRRESLRSHRCHRDRRGAACAPIAKREVALGRSSATRPRTSSADLRQSRLVLRGRVPACEKRSPMRSLRGLGDELPRRHDDRRLAAPAFHRGIFGVASDCRRAGDPVAVRCSEALAWYGNAPFVPHYTRRRQSAAGRDGSTSANRSTPRAVIADEVTVVGASPGSRDARAASWRTMPQSSASEYRATTRRRSSASRPSRGRA